MIQPRILVKGEFYPTDISISTSISSSRKINATIEPKLNQTWASIYEVAVTNNQKVYDGDCFRLEEFKTTGKKLELTIFPMKYSLATSLAKLLADSESEDLGYQPMKLCIGGFIKTSDNKYIFGQRSGKTISNNNIDFIGGNLEGSEINSTDELFTHNAIEIEEEINISKEFIDDMFVTALILTSIGSAILITSTSLTLSSDQTLIHFKENKNDDEMSDLIFKNFEDLPEFLDELGSYKTILKEILPIL